jgi:hexosaminidase
MKYSISLFSLLLILSCTAPTKELSTSVIIPEVANSSAAGNEISLPKEWVTVAPDISNRLLETLASQVTELGIEISKKEVGSANLILNLDATLDAESYRLQVTKEHIEITGGSEAGVFYAWQTLRQLLYNHFWSEEKWNAVDLSDTAKYIYRSYMLDVSRHFFNVETIKAVIDQISLYKINHMHLHLSDDQGWRIEINSWPELTTTGGATEVGGGEGGYLTQEDYKEIQRYAQERFITIVPEIDIPGHTNAALASYAELNCDGKATELYTGTEVGFSTLCAEKEVTYTFLSDVFTELAELTEGPYLHIGGDESHVTSDEDYVKIVDFSLEKVLALGKTPIGWDEITNANLDERGISQYWASRENTSLAASKKASVIISPAAHAYLDMQYDSLTPLGLHWAGYLSVKKSYEWNPETLVEDLDPEQIIGIEAPLWSETLENLKDIEYMTFPRLPGLAEIAWSTKDRRSWETYKRVLERHIEWLVKKGINTYKSLD